MSGADYAPSGDGAAALAGVNTQLTGDRMGTCYQQPPTIGAIEVR